MNNPETLHGMRPAPACRAFTPHASPVGGAEAPTGHAARHDLSRQARPIGASAPPTKAKTSRMLQLALVAMACSLCATAMAQQKPLTGHMLDGRTATPAAETAPPAPAPAQPQPSSNHVARQPATTYPAAPTLQARTTATADYVHDAEPGA